MTSKTRGHFYFYLIPKIVIAVFSYAIVNAVKGFIKALQVFWKTLQASRAVIKMLEGARWVVKGFEKLGLVFRRIGGKVGQMFEKIVDFFKRLMKWEKEVPKDKPHLPGEKDIPHGPQKELPHGPEKNPDKTSNLPPNDQGIARLGEWGEKRLSEVLDNQGFKPKSPFKTSLSNRYVDRLVNGIAHEAKAGINVKLTSSIETQILKDVELIQTSKVQGVVWHFFQGADKSVLDFLTSHGIQYIVH